MSKVYAFDVDETLEISNGPVKLQSLMDLRNEGHIVGLCGNVRAVMTKVVGWQNLVSFTFGPYSGGSGTFIPKWSWLKYFKETDCPGMEDYIMVGNILGEKNSLGFVCGSNDSEMAAAGGWKFLKEDDFANGRR